MADVTVLASGVLASTRGVRNYVFVSEKVGYIFYHDASSDFVYKKTTDGGATWGSAVAISGAETMVGFDVWYDQWTPGDKGSIIHIWYFGTSADDIIYKTLNTSSDTLSGGVTVFNGATSVAGRGTFVTGAKMRGGNLYCIFDIDAFAETGTYRSTDNGVTWASRTNVLEATLDECILFPGNEADNQDAWVLYQDASTDELTLYTIDDSANTNSESAAINGAVGMIENVTDATGQRGFSGAIRHSDGHLIAAFFTAYDTATEDFKVYDINGAGSITALTNITTDIDDMYFPSVFINTKNDDIYISYIGKSDGSETMGTTVGVYYAKSTDRGTTWTKDIAYSENAAGNMRHTYTPLNGPLFIVFWFNAATPVLLTNASKSVMVYGTQFPENYKFPRSVSAGVVSITEKIK